MPLNTRPSITRRNLLKASAFVANAAALQSVMPAKLFAQTGAPAGAQDAYAIPKADISGPVLPNWHSVGDFYRVPKWFHGAKIGIFTHCPRH